jgi:hypothetical protein
MAVIGRMRIMLEEPPHQLFNVTQTYSLFTTILCWVMQRIRIPVHEIESREDRIAHGLYKRLSDARIANAPWLVSVAPALRIASIGGHRVPIPPPENFETHSAMRFLINLRDATAHGDARNVFPFNVAVGSENLLAGFRFACSELRQREPVWQGSIVLPESDMRRIGTELAWLYCDALRRSEPHRRDSQFGSGAASIREAAA